MLDAAFRGSKRYWSILAVWMALIVIGGIAFRGDDLTGMFPETAFEILFDSSRKL
jgi:hypothetical protein